LCRDPVRDALQGRCNAYCNRLIA